jgi:hypothetical protein
MNERRGLSKGRAERTALRDLLVRLEHAIAAAEANLRDIGERLVQLDVQAECAREYPEQCRLASGSATPPDAAPAVPAVIRRSASRRHDVSCHARHDPSFTAAQVARLRVSLGRVFRSDPLCP